MCNYSKNCDVLCPSNILQRRFSSVWWTQAMWAAGCSSALTTTPARSADYMTSAWHSSTTQANLTPRYDPDSFTQIPICGMYTVMLKKTYSTSLLIILVSILPLTALTAPGWWRTYASPQGKSFIKDALKCMAHGLRHRFSCVSRKCLAVKEMVFQLQRECYVKHNLCSAVTENVNVMVEMIHFKDLFPKGWVLQYRVVQY